MSSYYYKKKNFKKELTMKKNVTNVFKIINLFFDNISFSFARKGNHIREVNLKIVFLIKLYLITVKNSVNTVYEKLTNYKDTSVRKKLGIKYSSIPCLSTIYGLIKRNELKQLKSKLRRKITKSLLHFRNVRILIMDMTDLPKQIYDKVSNYGYCSKGRFYGYKLHLVVTNDEIPIAFCISKANKRETSFVFRLFSEVRELVGDLKIKYVIGDKGYDSNKAHNQIYDLTDGLLLSPINPRKSKYRLKRPLENKYKDFYEKRGKRRDLNCLIYYSEKGKRLYKNKVKVERVHDEIKNDLSFSDVVNKISGVNELENELGWYMILLIGSKFYKKLQRNKIWKESSEFVLEN